MADNKVAKRNSAMKFFKETKAELKKVSWPTREQLFHNTLVILAFVAITTIILSLLDVGFEKLLALIIK